MKFLQIVIAGSCFGLGLFSVFVDSIKPINLQGTILAVLGFVVINQLLLSNSVEKVADSSESE